MLSVNQFRYGGDNFGYLIHGRKDAVVIDGGAFKEIFEFIQHRKLNLLFIANTHGHYDHTSGNNHFIRQSNIHVINYHDLINERKIELEGENINVYNTPGHTDDSVCFHAGKILISGDTLFNGTIGNCFSGDLDGYYETIMKIMSLPDETIIYAGHDYVKDAMSFAKMIEPDNEDIPIYLRKYNSHHVLSTLADELRVNPYLRFNEANIIAMLKLRGLPCETNRERWRSLMTID